MSHSANNIVLEDAASGARAEVRVDLGCNCHRLRLVCDDQPVEVLWAVSDFATLGGHPCGSGIPLLFPFPGRIREGATSWKSRRYQLPVRDAEGAAIHGFVMDRPWRLKSQEGGRLLAEFHLGRDAPELLGCWPSDFQVTAQFELAPDKLAMTFRVLNSGDEPLPCGLGLHPYFCVPLGSRGSGAECLIQLPVATTWELDQLIATGRKLPLANAARYQAGQPYADLTLDALFGDLQFDGEVCEAAVVDEANKRRMTLRFSKPFREIVVYTPVDRRSICIEPWSCITDPLRLTEEGVDAGLSIIAPQQSLDFCATIALESLA